MLHHFVYEHAGGEIMSRQATSTALLPSNKLITSLEKVPLFEQVHTNSSKQVLVLHVLRNGLYHLPGVSETDPPVSPQTLLLLLLEGRSNIYFLPFLKGLTHLPITCQRQSRVTSQWHQSTPSVLRAIMCAVNLCIQFAYVF